jgi:hypothetical protein
MARFNLKDLRDDDLVRFQKITKKVRLDVDDYSKLELRKKRYKRNG